MKISKRTSILLILLAISTLLLFIGCTKDDSPVEPDHPEQHWSYEGETGPDHWGEINSDYYLCAEGKNQSPVNIVTASVIEGDLPDIEFHYYEGPLEILNNGHAIEAEVHPGSYIMVSGVRYDLLQFHFHSSSEHTVDGQHYLVEGHFVHKNDNDELAVIGVFFERGAENTVLKPIWDHMPQRAEETFSLETEVNPEEILPHDRRTYRYSGSLTTPPCSEGVKWFVMATPVTLSDAQVSAFQTIYDYNYRPVLPINARQVALDGVVK